MIWLEYALFFLASFGMSWLISRRMHGGSPKWTVYDRKSLPKKQPTSGGIAIVVPFLIILAVVSLLNPLAMNAMQKPLVGLLLASFMIAGLGLYDDLRGANAGQKIAIQAAAVMVLIVFGMKMEVITSPFAASVALGSWGNIFLIVWVILLTNAVNLIDGIDGLAAGVCLISSVTLFIIGHIFGENTLAVFSIIIAGGLFGFIRYNLPPAKIYLGDTGSLFLGFALAAVSVFERRKGTVTVTLLVPVLIMAVPLIDAALAFFRRVKSGQNPMKGDERHIHHRLIKLGLTASQVNFILYLFCIYLGITAVVLSFMPKETAMVVLILLAIGILMLLEILRSIEKWTSKAPSTDSRSKDETSTGD